MQKGVSILGVLSLICFVIQLLPIISVPITGAGVNYRIRLSTYNNNTFGVFGVCDLDTQRCSQPAMGYPSKHSSFYPISEKSGYDDRFGGIQLPSRATYTISKLLVVHVIAFCFTAMSFLVIAALLFVIYLGHKGYSSPTVAFSHMKYKLLRNEQHADEQSRTSEPPKTKIDISVYLSFMLFGCLFSFLSTLLGFLVDILLFIPHLSYLGWLQLLPMILLAIQASMICFIKRTISTRRYLEEEYKAGTDDMRIRKNVDVDRWDNDSASDDGFYVYTNGFYSNYNDNGSQNKTNGGWIRHSPYNDTADEEVSINSSQLGHMDHDTIELSQLNGRSNQITSNDRTLC